MPVNGLGQYRVVLAYAPPDGDHGAPRWGRLCPASGGVDHWLCSRPPWLGTTGTSRGGGEGGTMSGVKGGSGGRRRHDAAFPYILVAVRQSLRRGCRSFIGNNGQQTNDKQKLTKGGFWHGVSIWCPYPPPPKKDTIFHWDWGEGVARFDLVQKGRAGKGYVIRHCSEIIYMLIRVIYLVLPCM